MAQCVVCSHDDRAKIEEALLCRSWGDNNVPLQAIADEFSVPIRALQVHSLMHLPINNIVGDASSITEKIKMQEGEILRAVANEYYVTLKNLGAKINKAVANNDSMELKVVITTQVVDLYLGCGARVRESIDGLVKLNQAANGEQNSGLNALASLITSLHGNKDDEEETDD